MSEQDDVTRALPHAVGPEKSIISTMLKDPLEYIGLALEEGLTPEHFYLPAHRVLFEVISDLYGEGKPVELISLIQLLLDSGKLDSVGGPAEVTGLYTYAPAPGQFRYHLGIVKEKFVARALIQSCHETTRAVFESPDEIDATLDQAEASIMAIREGKDTTKIENIKEAVRWVIDDFEERLNGKTDVPGLETGFPLLDQMSGGLKPGEMFVVAARPSMGKTSFMMNVVEHVALDLGLPALVFSLEMTQRQLVQRFVNSRAKFDPGQLTRGYTPTKADLQRIQRAALETSAANLMIDDTQGITISQLRAKARRKKREKGIALIAVDYLQLMRSYTKQATNSREREVSEISSGLKGLAKELGVPVMVLAQLNRGPESRASKKVGVPRMSDLRESGSIEQDADLIGLLYRSAYYAETDEEKDEQAGRAELILAKNRNGSTGSVPLTFIAELSRFEPGRPVTEREPEPARTWQR